MFSLLFVVAEYSLLLVEVVDERDWDEIDAIMDEWLADKTRDDVVLTLADGVTVRWGSAEQSDRKAAVLAALLKVRAATNDVSAPDLPTSKGSAPPAR